jgi:hypothetical protein
MSYEEAPEHVACLQVGGEATATDKAELAELGQHAGYAQGGYLSVAFKPVCLDHFERFCSQPSISAFSLRYCESCLFLHWRYSPLGHERLVLVGFGVSGTINRLPPDLYEMTCTVIRPATVFTKPEEISVYARSQNVSFTTDSGNSDFIRFFTGRSDPTDPSHFTIDVDIGCVPDQHVPSQPASGPLTAHGTIDGWLQDNDAVRLKPRGVKIVHNTWSLNDLMQSPTTEPNKR